MFLVTDFGARKGERDGGSKRERNVDLLFHLFMLSLVNSSCSLTENQTPNLGVSG